MTNKMLTRGYICVVCGERGDGSHKCSPAAEARYDRSANREPLPIAEELNLRGPTYLHDALTFWEVTEEGVLN